MTVAPVVCDLLGGGVVLLQKFRAAKVVRFFGSALVSLKMKTCRAMNTSAPRNAAVPTTKPALELN